MTATATNYPLPTLRGNKIVNRDDNDITAVSVQVPFGRTNSWLRAITAVHGLTLTSSARWSLLGLVRPRVFTLSGPYRRIDTVCDIYSLDRSRVNTLPRLP